MLYIVAFALFIQGLRGLAGPTTAVRGNRIAAVGMAIAVVATLLNPGEGNWGLIVLGVALGCAVGIPAARNVKMTAMPQMVALFNGVGGGAVALISWVEFRHYGSTYGSHTVHLGRELGNGVVLQTGASIQIARGADVRRDLLGVRGDRRLGLLLGLEHRLRQAPGNHPRAPDQLRLRPADRQPRAADPRARGRHRPGRRRALRSCCSSGCSSCAALLGNAVVLPIGGADMPVVISLLNAFTGLSAAATGMALNNPALIVAGMIVGASGTILTNLMATAMNRSIPSIIAGGFGGGGAVAGAEGAGEHAGTVRSMSAADAAIQLAYANRVVIVPGYGMAVAQAQHAVRELTKELEARQVEVSYAIHPVAGRMPGHMNVLLAEADVPYDQLQRDGRRQPRVPAHRRLARDRRQRRDQPGREEHALLADLRDADPRGRRLAFGDRDQALDEPRLRRHRERAVLRPEDGDAVRGREVGGERDRRRARSDLTDRRRASLGPDRSPPGLAQI